MAASADTTTIEVFRSLSVSGNSCIIFTDQTYKTSTHSKVEYRVGILDNTNNYIQNLELNLISSDVKDENALEKKWYFICRNKCLLSLIDLRDVISKYKLKGYFIMLWIRSMLHPRSRYTWKSLLGFCLSGKALKFEIEKKIAKMGG